MIDRIKWGSSIILSIGIALTSYNIYPLNLYVQVIGVSGWLLVGYLCNDKPLTFINFIGVVTLLSGIWYSLY